VRVGHCQLGIWPPISFWVNGVGVFGRYNDI
jgi:hypothetical protein